MATIDLGKIKFVNKGAYNNSTPYTPDDVVTSGGSSYICKLASTGNAVTNGTYWDVLAQAGTDVGTTLTTQGDLLYRDGSGLQRLAKPASNKYLHQLHLLILHHSNIHLRNQHHKLNYFHYHRYL